MKRGNVSIYIDDLLDFDSIKVTCRKQTHNFNNLLEYNTKTLYLHEKEWKIKNLVSTFF